MYLLFPQKVQKVYVMLQLDLEFAMGQYQILYNINILKPKH